MKQILFQYSSLRVLTLIGVGVILADQVVLYLLNSSPVTKVWSFVLTGSLIGTVCLRCNKKRREEMEQAEKLRLAGTLAAGIAHEIRNPLTSLKGFLQLSGNKESPYTEIMLAEVERINMMVNELLEVASPKEIEYGPHYLQPLLQKVMLLLQPQALRNNIQLMGHYGRETGSLVVHGHENKLKQVFIHLIKDAIEVMPNGGNIIISLISDGQFAYIKIADEGPGIPQEHLGKAGEPFFTTRRQGTGPGLMISQRIIRDHHGTLSFRSAWKCGTVVTVQLPIFYESEGTMKICSGHND